MCKRDAFQTLPRQASIMTPGVRLESTSNYSENLNPPQCHRIPISDVHNQPTPHKADGKQSRNVWKYCSAAKPVHADWCHARYLNPYYLGIVIMIPCFVSPSCHLHLVHRNSGACNTTCPFIPPAGIRRITTTAQPPTIPYRTIDPLIPPDAPGTADTTFEPTFPLSVSTIRRHYLQR